MKLEDDKNKIKQILLSTEADYDPGLSNGLANDQALALDMLSTEISNCAWSDFAQPEARKLATLATNLRDLLSTGHKLRLANNGFWYLTDAKGRDVSGAKSLLRIVQAVQSRRQPELICWVPGVRLGHGGIFSNGETWFPEGK